MKDPQHLYDYPVPFSALFGYNSIFLRENTILLSWFQELLWVIYSHLNIWSCEPQMIKYVEFGFLGLGYLTEYNLCYFNPLSCKVNFSLQLNSILQYICTSFSLSIISRRAFNLFSYLSNCEQNGNEHDSTGIYTTHSSP